MKYQLHDTLQIDASAVRRTQSGYLVATPRVARTGIQLYSGHEVGKPQMDKVRVLRPEEAVFAPDSLASYAHKPVTLNHPPVAVTADNWSKYAKGVSADEVLRDGNSIRVPLGLMDASIIKAFDDGQREISMGYTCDLEWQPGETATGEAYDAVQSNISVNHFAVVRKGRAGPDHAIGDDDQSCAICGGHIVNGMCSECGWMGDADGITYADPGYQDDKKQRYPVDTEKHVRAAWSYINQPGNADKYSSGDLGKVRAAIVRAWKKLIDKNGPPSAAKDADDVGDNEGDIQMTDKTFTVDGITVTMSDVAAQVVQRALDDAAKKVEKVKDKAATEAAAAAKATTDLASAQAIIATKDAEIVTLKKSVEDAKLSPKTLDDMVRARGETIGKAKAILGDALVVDGKTDAEIRRQVVDAHLGDVAKGWNDDQVSASFGTIAASAKVSSGGSTADLAVAFRPGFRTDAATVLDKSYQDHDKYLEDAWKPKVA